MAIDLALAETAATRGSASIRFYRWDPPCLSLGRNQPAAGRYDLPRLRGLGIDVVRRPTGGGAVYHDDELTYAVALPARAVGGPRSTFRLVHTALARGLRALGLRARVFQAGGRRRPGPAPAPCFAEPAPGEVVVGGRKLVGSAQARVGRALLQHGSILIGGDQSPAVELVTDAAPRRSDPAPATLERGLGFRPSWPDLVEALSDGLRSALDADLIPGGLDAEERAIAARHLERFYDPAWTWRR